MNKFAKKVFCIGLSAAMGFSFVKTSDVLAAETRYNGSGRIETALKIARSGWPDKTDYAFIAAADDGSLIDSLIAAPLAKAYNAPILVNYKGDKLDADVLAQLKQWGVKKVFIVSSDKVLQKGIEDKLKAEAIDVERLGKDSNRETSLNIANALKQKIGGISQIFIASEDSSHLVDALSIASVAGIENMPIILSPQDKLPDDVKKFISDNKIEKSYVIGGQNVLSDSILKDAKGLRLSGDDRFMTNIAVLNNFKDALKFDKVYVASGCNGHLVDALAGSVLAAKNAAPIMLVGDDLSYDTKLFVRSNVRTDSKVEIFGAEGAVSTAVEKKVDAVIYGEESGLLNIQSASAVNLSLIKVVVNHKVSSIDRSQFLVCDNNGAQMEVSSEEIAPWDSEGKTVLVTLKNPMTSGSLYTINSVSFGGSTDDSDKPVVTDMKSTDYNKVEISFSEPIRLNGINIDISEKNNSSSKLNVISKAYVVGDPSKVEITTSEQKGSTLYNVDIYGAQDFLNRYMDKDSGRTFVGIAKDITTKLSVTGVQTLSSKSLLVSFNTKIDASKVSNVSCYNLNEAYGSGSSVSISAARMADASEAGSDNDAVKKNVVLTLSTPMKDSTLYKLIVSGLYTSTGVGMDSSLNSATFIGIGPFTSKMDMSDDGNSVTAAGSKKIRISFKRHMNKALLIKDNFSIAKIYENNMPLQIKSLNVIDDRNVELEVESMSNEMYKLTVLNLMDIDNNGFETNKNSKIFQGVAQAASITCITNASLQSDNVSLILTFDSSVGMDAADVSHYKISNGIGYPVKAELINGSPNSVKLTIPKTIAGRLYSITVTGIENADGEAIDKDGISANFVGSGVSASSPVVQSVIASDKNTLQILFDRSVKDSSIDGYDKIWTSSTNRLSSSGVIVYGKYTRILDSYSTTYAYQDPDNEDMLIIRVSNVDFTAKNANSNGKYQVKVKGMSSTTLIDLDSSDDDMQSIVISDVKAINKNTVRVTFNQPVEVEKSADFARVAVTQSSADYIRNSGYYSSSSAYRLINPTPVDTSFLTYDFAVLGGNLGTDNWLIVNPVISCQYGSGVHDYTQSNASGFVTLADEDSSKSGIQQVRQFTGSTLEPGVINNIPVSMKDSKTIEIYYPEVMNTAEGTNIISVLDKKNYKLVDMNGNEIAPSFLLIHACNISYDKTSNKAVISLNAPVPQSSKGYYIQFAKTLQNALGTKCVRKSLSENTETMSQFVPSTKEAAKVKIAPETSYSYSSRKLTIKLSQKATSVAQYDSVVLLADFKITVVDSDGLSYDLRSSDIESVATGITDSYSSADDTITVTLKETINGGKTLKAGAAGKLQFIPDNTLRGINGESVDNNSGMVFVQ